MVFLLADRGAGCTGLALTWEPTLQRINVPREWVGQYPPLDGLFRWDSGHYIILTQQGYDTLSARTLAAVSADLPLRLLGDEHARRSQHAAVANVASYIGILLVYRVVEKIEDSVIARTTILLFVASPFAFFDATAYPESLVVCLTAGAVLLALKGRHFLAGLVLAAAVLTRHVAIVVGAALLAARIRQRGVGLGFFRWDVTGLLLPFAAVGGYALYLKQRFDDPMAFVTARKLYWADGFSNIFTLSGTYAYSYIPITIVLLLCALALWTRNKWLELAPAATAWMILVIVVSATGLGRHTASIWRHSFLRPGCSRRISSGARPSSPVSRCFRACSSTYSPTSTMCSS